MKVDVVIIDTGIDVNHPVIKKNFDSIKLITISKNDDKFEVILDEAIDNIGHGTSVFHAITNRIKSNSINYCIIKIIDLYEDSNEDLLLYCFDYIYNNIDCKIINISAGILECSKKEEFEKICIKLKNSGVTIISAFANNGILSYPALFDSVIGVDFRLDITNRNKWIYVEDSPINILGYGGLNRLATLNNNYDYFAGASFASANILSIILEKFGNNLDYESIIKFLKNDANVVYTVPKLEEVMKPFKISKAVLFPFNKENKIVGGFTKILNLSIKDIYDIKYSGNVNKKISDLVPYLDGFNNEYVVKDIDSLDWDDDFDTFILGHVGLISSALNKDIHNFIIEKCLIYNKNLYCYDPITNESIFKFKNKGLEVFYPKVSNMNLYDHNLGKLYSHSAPVVGVFGTSPKQGKWSLTLKLIKEFEKNKYKISYLGTEPNAYFFGNGYSLPIGYNSEYIYNQRELISIINYFLHLLDNNVDLMFVTSQSQTVAASPGGFTTLPIEQSSLIIGAVPQAYILCVNPWDDFDYISRTIDYLCSYYEAQVISIVLFVADQYDVWDNIKGRTLEAGFDYNKIVSDLKKHFSIPTYLINDSNCIVNIYKDIVDYF